jgi:hypothetical protein
VAARASATFKLEQQRDEAAIFPRPPPAPSAAQKKRLCRAYAVPASPPCFLSDVPARPVTARCPQRSRHVCLSHSEVACKCMWWWESLVVAANVASRSIVCACVVHTAAKCTPPLTLPPPPPFIQPARFILHYVSYRTTDDTTGPGVVPCQNAETACRWEYVGVRDGRTEYPGKPGHEPGHRCSRPCCLSRRRPSHRCSPCERGCTSREGYGQPLHYTSQRPTDQTTGQGAVAYRTVATARRKGPMGMRGAEPVSFA